MVNQSDFYLDSMIQALSLSDPRYLVISEPVAESLKTHTFEPSSEDLASLQPIAPGVLPLSSTIVVRVAVLPSAPGIVFASPVFGPCSVQWLQIAAGSIVTATLLGSCKCPDSDASFPVYALSLR